LLEAFGRLLNFCEFLLQRAIGGHMRLRQWQSFCEIAGIAGRDQFRGFLQRSLAQNLRSSDPSYRLYWADRIDHFALELPRIRHPRKVDLPLQGAPLTDCLRPLEILDEEWAQARYAGGAERIGPLGAGLYSSARAF
jgi:hypothetical protein